MPPGVSLANAQRRMRAERNWVQVINTTATAALDGNSRPPRLAVTASATPHAKGAWSQLVASTTADINLLMTRLHVASQQNAVNTSALMDIGVGGAGSEQVIVPDLAVGASPGIAYQLPVFIPRGSRIAYRCQSAVANKVIDTETIFLKLPFDVTPPAKLVNFNANTATSRGVTCAAPGANNAKGAWTTMVAATSLPICVLGLGPQAGGSAGGMTASFGFLDIAIGSAGNEQIILPDLVVICSASEGWSLQHGTMYPVDIPAGTRIAARWQGADAINNPTLDLTFIGVPTR